MNKTDRIYFENLTGAADCSYKAANYLVECLTNYNAELIQTMQTTMHRFEHDGDMKKHEMSTMLAKAFVTPIDREDLEMISQNIDEVTDRIEEVLQQFYVDEIQTVTTEAIAFAQKLVLCCSVMQDMMAEFIHFKQPQKLHELIVKLNDLEEECDALYLEAIQHTRRKFDNALDVMAWRLVYEKMEKCADACEHVGDCVGMVVMKNS